MRRRVSVLLLWCTIVAAPTVESLLLVRFGLGASLEQYAPEGLGDLNVSHALFWSDELDNWHETRSFVTHGLDSGYYTYSELLAPLPIVRFGTHGPVYPLLYGGAGKLVGWGPYSGPVFNAVLLGLALLAFVALARPDRRQSLVMLGLLVVCWPLLLFIPSTMQESLHQSVALVLAGLFSGHVSHRRRHAVLALTLIAVIAVSRPTWGFLLLPFALLARPDARRVRVSVACLVGCALLFLIGRLVSPPYPYWFIADFFAKLPHQPLPALADWLYHLGSNLSRWTQPASDLPLVVVQRFQVLLLLGVAGWIAYRRWRTLGDELTDDDLEALLHVLNLGLPLAFVMGIYDTYFLRDYRFLAPHMLLSLFVFVARRRFGPVGATVLIFLLATPWFHTTYQELHRRHFADEAALMRPLEAGLAEHVVHGKDAPPWCNSLIAPIDLFPFLKTVPSGIGVSVTMGWREVRRPFKSRYLLLGADGPPPADARLRLLGAFPQQLYLNLDAKCPP